MCPREESLGPREAEIVMVLPLQTQGHGQDYEHQYLVRFDDGGPRAAGDHWRANNPIGSEVGVIPVCMRR